MASYNSKQFLNFMESAVAGVESAIKEVGEMQAAFNAIYVRRFQTEFEDLSGVITDQIAKKLINNKYDSGDPVYKSLKGLAEKKAAELAEKKKTLHSDIAGYEKKLLEIKNKGNAILDKYKRLSPELNEIEEKQKVVVARYEGSVITLRENIKKLSGGFGFIKNYFTLSYMKKQLCEQVETLKAEKVKLDAVRRKFLNSKTDRESRENELKKEYGDVLGKIAGARQALAALESDMAIAAAVAAVDEWLRGADAGTLKKIAAEIPQIDKFTGLRDEKKIYESGLKAVSEEIGFLTGIKSGFLNIQKSLQSISDQYEKYSAYLSAPEFEIPAFIEEFSGSFKKIAAAVVDDARLGLVPAEYVKIMAPFDQKYINEKNVKSVFDELGKAIKKSTSRW